jgi:hypothetical protein
MESTGMLAAKAGNLRASSPATLIFLLVRDVALHILDYKPDTRTNKPIAQLAS